MTRLEQLLELRRDNMNDPFLIYALAMEYAKEGDQQQALTYYEVLLSEHEQYVGTYYHAGRLYETLERLEDARETYLKGMAITKQKGDHHAFMELQAVYHSLMGIEQDDDDD